MYNYCTLFDSNYLDKGLVLYNSLEQISDKFHLYIFAFDDKTVDILKDFRLKHATVISLEEFETDEMLKVKKERSKAEYCWTCTPITIEYVLKNFAVEMCTYIDSDMMFFSSAKPIFEQMAAEGSSVLVTPHRFPNTKKGRALEKRAGRYCVEFNTFKNDENGITPLMWWKERCLEWCFFERSGELLGDQKYLDGWTEKFPGVGVVKNWGAGLAPWNINQCRYISHKATDVIFEHVETKKEWKLIFYHYQAIKYLPYGLVNIGSMSKDKKLKNAIYDVYLKKIQEIRELLNDNYVLEFNTNRVCSNNKVIAFVQKYIMPFKVNCFTDIKRARNIWG